MKRFIALLAFFLAVFAAPALAQVEVEKILVSRDSGKVRIEVYFTNPGDKRIIPGRVHLWVRDQSINPWRSVNTWQVQKYLEAGERRMEAYETKVGTDAAFAKDHFEVKLDVNGVDSGHGSFDGP